MIITVRQRLIAKVRAALDKPYQDGFLYGEPPQVDLTTSKHNAHGDFSCAVALNIANGSDAGWPATSLRFT